MSLHNKRFPGESQSYREARDALLLEEIELRRRLEEVAQLRRRLPSGGQIPQDYVFEEGTIDDDHVREVRLSELFEPDKDTLVLYNFMYGPEMPEPCKMCTSFIDGMAGNAVHLRDRVAIGVMARSQIGRFREHARTRGWRSLRLLSSAKNDFNRDYHGEDVEGNQDSMLHVFVRRDERIHHFWASELNMVPSDPGENERHLDTMWPLWSVLDLTPEGRGDWYPQLSYGSQ